MFISLIYPKKICLTLLTTGFLLSFSLESFSQSSHQADSLRKEHYLSQIDSTKGRLADDLAFAFYNLSIDSSLKYAKISAKYGQAAGDMKIVAQAHNTQGICYLNKASLMNALDHFQQAYELFKQVGDRRGEAKMLNNLGVIYTETQDYSRAKEKYEISYRLNTELGTWEAASNALYNISGSYFSLKDYDKSLVYANELREFHKAHPNTVSPAQLYGDIFEQKNELDSARYYLEVALKDQEMRGDIFNWCICLINLSRITLAQGHAEEAERILNKAEKAIKENEMMDAEFAFLNLKSKIYAELGLYKAAFDFQETALELNDSIDRLNQMNMINDMNTKYETDRMEFQIEEQQGIIESKQVWLATIMAVAILLVIGLFSVIYILRKNRKLNHLLKVQNLQINHQRQKIISSINYAKKIQQSTLPKEHDFKKLFKDSFIYFKPKDIISGDFYAYQQIDEKIYVAAVDCTGHGVPGAFMSLIANSKLNKVVNEMGERDPGKILTRMHREIQLSLHQENGEDHTMDGVEMSLCAIDLNKQTIEFAGAGSSIFIARNGVIHEFKGNFHGLGGADYTWKKDETPQLFTTQTITYCKEDLLYLFSDGIHDQIGGTELKKLNKSLFKEHLLNISMNALEHAAQGCDQFISDWRNQHQQTDDMMLIGIRL